MIKLQRIMSYVFLVLVGLIATIFAFIEIRSIFAGDFTLMQNPTSSVFGYIARSIFYLAMIANVVVLFVFKKKEKKTNNILLALSISLALASIPLFFFYMLLVAFLVLLLNIIVLAITFERLFSY